MRDTGGPSAVMDWLMKEVSPGIDELSPPAQHVAKCSIIHVCQPMSQKLYTA